LGQIGTVQTLEYLDIVNLSSGVLLDLSAQVAGFVLDESNNFSTSVEQDFPVDISVTALNTFSSTVEASFVSNGLECIGTGISHPSPF
jgi:hypothetical protein